MANSYYGASVSLCVCPTTPPLNAANPTTGSCSGLCRGGLPRTYIATAVSPSCPPSLRAAGMRVRGQSQIHLNKLLTLSDTKTRLNKMLKLSDTKTHLNNILALSDNETHLNKLLMLLDMIQFSANVYNGSNVDPEI